MAACVYVKGSNSGVAVVLGRPQGPLLRQGFLNERFTRNNSRDSRGRLSQTEPGETRMRTFSRSTLDKEWSWVP